MSNVNDLSTIEGRAHRLGRQAGHLEALAAAGVLDDKPAAFTAAAMTLDLGSQRAKNRYGRRGSVLWQEDAWTYYDVLPEVKSGAGFLARSLGELTIFPAWRPEPDADPIPLSAADDAPPELVALATAADERIDPTSSVLPKMASRWGSNGFVAGEGFAVVWDDPDEPSGVASRFVSIDELTITSRGQWAIVDEPGLPESEWTILPVSDVDGEPDALIIRVWNQHARFSQRPDSSIHGVLELCENLALIQALGIGATASRMSNGMLALPDTMLTERRRVSDVAQQGGDAPKLDPVIEQFMTHLMTPIADPRSAAAVVPFIVSGKREDIEAIRHIPFDRPLDGVADERTEMLVRRMAHAVDLPAEVLLGLADVNHWTAWLISDETYRAYVKPTATEFLRAMSTGYLQPMIMAGAPTAAFTDVGRFEYAHNADDLVADPDESERVFQAFEAGIIGGEPARRYLRFAEDDAPTAEDDERARTRRSSANSSDGPTRSGEEPATEDDAGDAVQAAGTALEPAPSLLEATSARWVDRDRDLRHRLHALAETAMSRALERAGARLRTRAQRSSAHRDVIDGVPNRLVASRLGPAVTRGLLQTDTDDDDEIAALLLVGAWEELAAHFETLTGRAQAAVIDELRALGVTDVELDRLAEEQAADRARGVTHLLAAMTALALARLYDPSPSSPEPGEADPSALVPPGVARSSLSIAGGGAGSESAGGAIVDPVTEAPSGGLSAGPSTRAAARTAGIVPTGYRWSYGDPSLRGSTFEPHLALDLLPFEDWTSSVLYNPNPWPRTLYFYPGDHKGCECDVYPILANASGDLNPGGDVRFGTDA